MLEWQRKTLLGNSTSKTFINILLNSKQIKMWIISEKSFNLIYANLENNELILIGYLYLQNYLVYHKHMPDVILELSFWILKVFEPHQNFIGAGKKYLFI